MWSFSNVFKSLFMIFIAFIAWLCVGIGIIVPFMTFTTAIYSILMPLFMEANVKGSGKPYTFSSALLDVFKYKISIIMYIVTYYMVTGAYSKFGSIAIEVFHLSHLLYFSFSPIFTKRINPLLKTPQVLVGVTINKQIKIVNKYFTEK